MLDVTSNTAIALPADRPLAIVIGVAQHARTQWNLRTAASDAAALAAALEQDHGYDIILRRDHEATREALRLLFGDELRARIAGRRRLLVYFAGHGIAEDTVGEIQGYLVPHDGDDDLGSLLPMHEIADALRAVECHHVLVVLDCCFAGAFNWAATRDVGRPPVMYKERFELYLASPTWQVLTSAAHDQRAADVLDGHALGQREDAAEATCSPFIAALLEGLSGKADILPRRSDGHDGDGIITATELYLYVREQVEPVTHRVERPQTPGLWRVRPADLGEFLFFTPRATPRLLDAPRLSDETCPYRGVESYGEGDRELFFGRDRVVEALHAHVERRALTIVIGASGIGKSSLVMAGLVPKLRHATPPPGIIGPLRPGAHPVAALEAALATRSEASSNYLIVDQLEEVVTMTENLEERDRFIARLLELAATGVKVITTLRADFEPSLWRGRLETGWPEARFAVPEMTQDELRDAIRRPAEARVLTFDPPELVDRLVNAVLGSPGALPLLSFTLKYLYSEMLARATGDRKLRGGDAHLAADSRNAAVGGIPWALQRTASGVMAALPEASRQTLIAIMLRMLTPQSGVLARRRVPQREFDFADPAEDRRVKDVLARLCAPDLRLVIGGSDRDGPYLEPAHDAVLQCWEEVGKALASSEELGDVLILRAVTRAAFEWHDSGRRRDLLWTTHPRLVDAGAALARRPLRWNRSETEFVTSSQQARVRRRRTIVSVVTTVMLTLIAATAISLVFQRRATREADHAQTEANHARAEARRATQAALGERATRAGLLARTPGREIEGRFMAVGTYAEARRAGFDPVTEINGLGDTLTAAATGSPLQLVLAARQGHGPKNAAFSDDGRRILVADGTVVRMFDAASGCPRTAHDDTATFVAALHGQNHFVTNTGAVIAADGTVTHPAGRAYEARSGWLSVDGTRLAAFVTSDREPPRLDVVELPGGRVTRLPLAPDDVASPREAMFSPDLRVLYYLPDGYAVVVAYDLGAARQRTSQSMIGLHHASVSADGTALLATGEDFPAGLLNRELQPEVPLPDKLYAVQASAFSPADHRYFVTVGGRIAGSQLLTGDRTVRLWEQKDGARSYTPNNLYSLAPLTGNEFVVFSSDGQRIAVGSESEDIRIYDVGTLEIRATLNRAMFGGKELIDRPRFSSSGDRILVMTADAVFVVAIEPQPESKDALAETCARLRCRADVETHRDAMEACH